MHLPTLEQRYSYRDNVGKIHQAPSPGGPYNVPFEGHYLRWPYRSNSVLKEANKSARHMREAANGDFVATDEMRLGSALHCCFLEPEQALQRIAVYNGKRQGGDWETFRAVHADKIILIQSQYEQLQGMLSELRRHKWVRETIEVGRTQLQAFGANVPEGSLPGVVEASMVFEDPETGQRCKLRADLIWCDGKQFHCVDLKSCKSADPILFANSAHSLGYWQQAALYVDGIKRACGIDCTFTFLCVESKGCHDVVPYRVKPEHLRVGRKSYKRALKMWDECEKSGHWPGRSEEALPLATPRHAVPTSVDLVVHGQPVTIYGDFE